MARRGSILAVFAVATLAAAQPAAAQNAGNRSADAIPQAGPVNSDGTGGCVLPYRGPEQAVLSTGDYIREVIRVRDPVPGAIPGGAGAGGLFGNLSFLPALLAPLLGGLFLLGLSGGGDDGPDSPG